MAETHALAKWQIMFCLVALHIAPFELVMPIFFSVLVQFLTLMTVVKQMHVVDSLGTVFPKEQYFDWMNLQKQNFVCWPSVGPQDIKHKHTSRYSQTLSQLVRLSSSCADL